MNETWIMELVVPERSNLTDDDLAVLQAACENMVEQSCLAAGNGAAQVQAMAAEGWRVESGLTWIARAERDHESEEAVGDTRGQALCRLCQLTGLHTVDGCP